MPQSAAPSADAKPPLHISEGDYDVIATMALGLESRAPELSSLLMGEIDRAEIMPAADLPADVVTLGSEVEFLDEANGSTRSVRLVMPAEADIEAGRISILTPIGAGLIGMHAGREIDWTFPDGRQHKLRILKVNQTP